MVSDLCVACQLWGIRVVFDSSAEPIFARKFIVNLVPTTIMFALLEIEGGEPPLARLL
jgi:hypothetical protein